MGRWLLAAAFVLLTAGCLLQAARGSTSTDLSGHAAGSDDAFISYRYAQNLIAGHGLVFNPGERVEGYTNLLYVLLLVPAAWLAGPERLLAVSIGFNLLCAAAALLGFFRFVRERLGGARAGLAALALALCPSLWVAVASGLETPLVLVLQMALWIAVERTVEREEDRRLLPLAILTVLTGLARADGFIAPLLAALYLALRGRRRAALAVAAVSLATLAALVAWRLAYYGWPLPNTYYAKVAGSLPRRIGTALPQLSRVVFTTGLLVPVVALLLTILRLARQVSRGQAGWFSGLSFPVFFAPAWVGYWIYVGGDVFYERFLLILFPLGIYALLQLLRAAPRAATVASLGLVVLLQLAQLGEDPRYRYTREASRPQPPGGDPGDRRRREDPVLLGSSHHRHAGADRRAHRPRGAAAGRPVHHRPQQVRHRVRAGAPPRPHRDMDPVRFRHEVGARSLAVGGGGLPAAVPGQRGAASADPQPAGRFG